jgi:hypothetical protein
VWGGGGAAAAACERDVQRLGRVRGRGERLRAMRARDEVSGGGGAVAPACARPEAR